MMTTTDAARPLTAKAASRQVVVVSKHSRLNGSLEMVLDAGRYDVVLVESTEHAYSHIKRMTPNLIVVCLDVDDLDGFQVLSMLKLDADTRGIPVITCATAQEAEDVSDETLDPPESAFEQPPAMQLN